VREAAVVIAETDPRQREVRYVGGVVSGIGEVEAERDRLM
jgi:hypothetical protein